MRTDLIITTDRLEVLSSEKIAIFLSSSTKIFSLSLKEEIEEYKTETSILEQWTFNSLALTAFSVSVSLCLGHC